MKIMGLLLLFLPTPSLAEDFKVRIDYIVEAWRYSASLELSSHANKCVAKLDGHQLIIKPSQCAEIWENVSKIESRRFLSEYSPYGGRYYKVSIKSPKIAWTKTVNVFDARTCDLRGRCRNPRNNAIRTLASDVTDMALAAKEKK